MLYDFYLSLSSMSYFMAYFPYPYLSYSNFLITLSFIYISLLIAYTLLSYYYCLSPYSLILSPIYSLCLLIYY